MSCLIIYIYINSINNNIYIQLLFYPDIPRIVLNSMGLSKNLKRTYIYIHTYIYHIHFIHFLNQFRYIQWTYTTCTNPNPVALHNVSRLLQYNDTSVHENILQVAWWNFDYSTLFYGKSFVSVRLKAKRCSCCSTCWRMCVLCLQVHTELFLSNEICEVSGHNSVF